MTQTAHTLHHQMPHATSSGHQQLSGAGKALEFIVKENIGVKVRSVEVNVLQRCASHLASLTDIEESLLRVKGCHYCSRGCDRINGMLEAHLK